MPVQPPTVSDLLTALNVRYPWARAESWDKVGLHIGDRAAPVQRVFVAYEVTEAVLDAAQGYDAIVAYHPLLFRPLESLDFSNHTARLAARIVAAGQSLICVHTALDGAEPPHALGDALARQLGLHNVRVHQPSGSGKLVKIVTFVPPEALEPVSMALWAAGAGQIGRYDQASFRARGTGTFRPNEGANPYSGQLGQRNEADEWRLEVIAPETRWHPVVAALKATHPYEEVAYDVTMLLNADENQGYGPLRIASGVVSAGGLQHMQFEPFVAHVESCLRPPSLRIVRADDMIWIDKIACSPGSGASFIDGLPSGTVFVTGDIKHHDALKARAQGVSIIDVSHAATETAAVPLMAEALQTVVGLEVGESTVNSNPFTAS